MSSESQAIKRLKNNVLDVFQEVRLALDVREKMLLRQVDVIVSQWQNQGVLIDEIKFIPNEEIDIMESIRCFGKFNMPHLNFASDLYVSEDYICPDVDHETMYKCLNTKDEVDTGIKIEDDPENMTNERQNQIDSDIFNTKILKEHMNIVNESIVKLTLMEENELIKNVAKPCGENKPIDETKSMPEKMERVEKIQRRVRLNDNERIAQASQTEMESSSKLKKPNITINNCNGTINLKNISNLTINCSGQTSIQTNQKANMGTGATTNIGESDVVSSTIFSETEPLCENKDSENNSMDCEFYNRLIKEIKHTIKNHQRSQKDKNETTAKHLCTSTEVNGNETCNRKLLLKNFENLKIVLENNENDTHPIQIEQWLTEIISETEIEPMQNTGILEHSKFSGKNLC